MSSINTNLMSLNAQRNLSTSASSLATSIQRLSSGLRVNSAKDDAAGLAISERMDSQVRGMAVAQRNAGDAISMSQTAEGALGQVGDMLQRMRELAVQSANGTNSTADRTNLQSEYSQLSAEVNRNLNGTSFNGTSLFTSGTAFSFQVGAGTSTNDTVSINRSQLTGGTASTATGAALVTAMGTATADVTLATATGINIGTSAATAQDAMVAIDAALSSVNTQRPQEVALSMQTMRWKAPTSPALKSCNRPALPCYRRPTKRLTASFRSCDKLSSRLNIRRLDQHGKRKCTWYWQWT
jgi:flagellin